MKWETKGFQDTPLVRAMLITVASMLEVVNVEALLRKYCVEIEKLESEILLDKELVLLVSLDRGWGRSLPYLCYLMAIVSYKNEELEQILYKVVFKEKPKIFLKLKQVKKRINRLLELSAQMGEFTTLAFMLFTQTVINLGALPKDIKLSPRAKFIFEYMKTGEFSLQTSDELDKFIDAGNLVHFGAELEFNKKYPRYKSCYNIAVALCSFDSAHYDEYSEWFSGRLSDMSCSVPFDRELDQIQHMSYALFNQVVNQAELLSDNVFLSSAKITLRNMDKVASEAVSESNKLNGRVIKLEAKLLQSQNNITSLEKTIVSRETELRELKQEMSNLVEAARKEALSEMSSMKYRAETAEKTASEAKSNMAEMQREIAYLKQQVELLIPIAQEAENEKEIVDYYQWARGMKHRVVIFGYTQAWRSKISTYLQSLGVSAVEASTSTVNSIVRPGDLVVMNTAIAHKDQYLIQSICNSRRVGIYMTATKNQTKLVNELSLRFK